jgi:hypothetical protein
MSKRPICIQGERQKEKECERGGTAEKEREGVKWREERERQKREGKRTR